MITASTCKLIALVPLARLVPVRACRWQSSILPPSTDNRPSGAMASRCSWPPIAQVQSVPSTSGSPRAPALRTPGPPRCTWDPSSTARPSMRSPRFRSTARNCISSRPGAGISTSIGARAASSGSRTDGEPLHDGHDTTTPRRHVPRRLGVSSHLQRVDRKPFPTGSFVQPRVQAHELERGGLVLGRHDGGSELETVPRA